MLYTYAVRYSICYLVIMFLLFFSVDKINKGAQVFKAMGNYMPTGSGEAGTPVDVVDDSLHHHKPSNREALKAATLARQQSYQRTDSVDRVENSRDSQFTTPEERGHRKHIRNIDYKKYEYKFDNIVFEGGGAKGIVYVGVLEVRLCFIELEIVSPFSPGSNRSLDLVRPVLHCMFLSKLRF